jgi:hypothetical protein
VSRVSLLWLSLLLIAEWNVVNRSQESVSAYDTIGAEIAEHAREGWG